MSVNLILGSTSVYRKELLQRLGIPFQCQKPNFDEDSAKNQNSHLEPLPLAKQLALHKALSLAGPGNLVIGGDQLVHFKGQVLGKPGHFEKARECLEFLSGGTHELITAVAIVSSERTEEFCDITRLTMRHLTRSEIETYLQADEPWDCAGSYKIEKRGISLMEKIETEDFTAIQGLPLIQLAKSLRSFGVPL